MVGGSVLEWKTTNIQQISFRVRCIQFPSVILILTSREKLAFLATELYYWYKEISSILLCIKEEVKRNIWWMNAYQSIKVKVPLHRMHSVDAGSVAFSFCITQSILDSSSLSINSFPNIFLQSTYILSKYIPHCYIYNIYNPHLYLCPFPYFPHLCITKTLPTLQNPAQTLDHKEVPDPHRPA